MRRALALAPLAVGALLAPARPASASPSSPGPARGFVRAIGDRLVVDGRPFRFVGANVEVMHGVARARAEETLAAVAKDGLTVARIWVLGEAPADATPKEAADARRQGLFRVGPDGWIEEAALHLDRVVAAARARHLRLVVTLANQWGDYGGVPMYLRWSGLPPTARDRFWSDPDARARYRAHVERLLDRVNTVTGTRYGDDPTIAVWELMNESQVDSRDGARDRLAWIREMAGAVKARARQLVSAGVFGYTTRAERAAWLEACRLPEVDVCDSHLYLEELDRIDSPALLDGFLDDRAQLARFVAKKPLLVGEFGLHTERARPPWLGRPRAAWVEALLARLFADGGAGALVWIYQPWLGRERDFGVYVDRPDTDDVRAALGRIAARVRGAGGPPPNRHLSAQLGDTMLYDPYRTLRQAAVPARALPVRDGQARFLIAPEAFVEGRFERVGVWRGGALVHAYGAGDGAFRWPLPAPPSTPRALTLTMRLSAEAPGTPGPAQGRPSRVSLRLDGQEVATLSVVADDGAGRVETVRVDDPALLRRVSRPGVHWLELAVPPGPEAEGLAVYGEPTGAAPPPVGESTPIVVDWTL